jgi:hypothetical protein
MTFVLPYLLVVANEVMPEEFWSSRGASHRVTDSSPFFNHVDEVSKTRSSLLLLLPLLLLPLTTPMYVPYVLSIKVCFVSTS